MAESTTVGENQLVALEKKLPLGTIGIILTLVLGVASLAISFRRQSPEVTFEIVSVANVLDVHRPLADLTITFKGEDIQKTQKNLKVVTVSLVNAGTENVRQADYDQNEPFGFRLVDAEIVGAPRIANSDSAYLEKNLHPVVEHDDTVVLGKAILERGKTTVFEVVILQNRDVGVAIEALGKIADQDKILVRKRESESEKGFWHGVIEGGVVVNAVRAIVGFFATVVLLAGVVAAAVKWSSWSEAREKRRYIKYIRPLVCDCSKELRAPLLALLGATDGNPYVIREVKSRLADPTMIEKYAAKSTDNTNRADIDRIPGKVARLRYGKGEEKEARDLAKRWQDEIILRFWKVLGELRDGRVCVRNEFLERLEASAVYLEEYPQKKTGSFAMTLQRLSVKEVCKG